MKIKIYHRIIPYLVFTAILFISGCGATADSTTSDLSMTTSIANELSTSSNLASLTAALSTSVDLDILAAAEAWDDASATHITLDDTKCEISGTGAISNDSVVTINASGTYVITGKLSDGQIVIDAGNNDSIHLVLNGIDITCSDNAPIYLSNAGETTITLVKGTFNTITDAIVYKYESTDETEPDAALFSKGDLIINGSGSLTVNANYHQGIVSKKKLIITNGSFTITSADDAIKGKDSLVITDGNFTIQAGDDALHTDTDLRIDNGTFNITGCYEGLEGATITINDGNINITASDDGLNATGGTDESDTVNTGDDDSFTNNSNYNIYINGGTMIVSTDGDSIDSNGNIYQSGGTVTLYGPTNDGNGVIDYNGVYEITGGFLNAVGSSGMAQSPSDSSSQASLMLLFDTVQQAGSTVTIQSENNTTVAEITSQKSYSCVIFSSCDLQQSNTYTITSGGTELCTITLEDMITCINEDGSITQGGMGNLKSPGGPRNHDASVSGPNAPNGDPL